MEFIFTNGQNSHFANGIVYMNQTKKSGEDDMFEGIKMVTVIVLLVVGLIVNSVLIVAIRRSPRLKAPIFQLLFALAFADLILLVAYALPELGSHFNDGKWIFGAKGCSVLVSLRFLPAHVTNCLIVVCCWERFYAVCRPHSAMWITSRKMSGIIALCWLINAGIVAPLVVLTKPVELQYSDGSRLSGCHLTMASDIKKLYFTIMGMVFYGITAIVSVVFLSCTLCKIVNVDLENYFIKDDFKNHILRCIAVITGASILSWIPHYYAYFYHLHSGDGSHADSAIIILGLMLVIVGAVIKPILYISVSSQFRKAIIRALSCCRKSNIEIKYTHGYKMNDRLMLAEMQEMI